MSGQATGWVLREGPRPTDIDRTGRKYGQRARGLRAVLVTIADAANRDGEHAHPGQQAMVDGSLYSRGQVVALVNELLAEGWITVEAQGGGRGKATVYGVNMRRRETAQPSDGFSEENRAAEQPKPRGDGKETARSDALNRAEAPALTSGNARANEVPTEQPNEEHNARESAPLRLLSSEDPGPTFDAFWQAYPRGDGRPAAIKAWDKALKAAPPERIMEGLAAWLAYWQARNEPEFIPWAQKWLNQQQWFASPPALRRGQQPARQTSGAWDRSAPSGAVEL